MGLPIECASIDTVTNDLRRFVYSHDDETGKGEPKTPVRTPELPSTLQGRTR